MSEVFHSIPEVRVRMYVDDINLLFQKMEHQIDGKNEVSLRDL